MNYLDENNELLTYIINTYLDGTKSLNLITKPNKCSACVNCTDTLEYNIEDIKHNLLLILEHFKNYKFNKVHINLCDTTLLEILYEFFAKHPISDIIVADIDHKIFTLDDLNNLVLNLVKFDDLNIKFVPQLIITEYDDLASDIVQFAIEDNWIIKIVLNSDILSKWDRLEGWDKIANAKNIYYVESKELLDEEILKLYQEFIGKQFLFDGDVEALYNKFYKEEKYKDFRIETNTEFQCELQQSLNIRVQDLAIIPCSGITENKFKFGSYLIKDDKLELQATNVEFASLILTGDTTTMYPTCDLCTYKNICNGGCLKAYYKATRDILMPVDSYCKFQIWKSKLLLSLYKQTGLLDYIIKNKL